MRLSSTLSKQLFDSLLDPNEDSFNNRQTLEKLSQQGETLSDLLEFYPGLFPFERMSQMSKDNAHLLFRYGFPSVSHRKFTILPALLSSSFSQKKLLVTSYALYNDINKVVEGKTLLDHALLKGDRQLVQILLQNGALITSLRNLEGQLASDLGVYGILPYRDNGKSVKSSLGISQLRQQLLLL